MKLFDVAVEAILKSEGGLVDHPHDPGGLTNMGISLRAYPDLGREGIKNLTREEAIAIYKRDYWDRIPAHLPDGLRWMAFDAAVNHGVSRALAWLEHYDNVVDYAAARLDFYTGLSTWNSFGRGWTRRISNLLYDIADWVIETRGLRK